MLARICDNHWINLEQVVDGIEEIIVQAFSVRDPKARFISEGPWDGWYRRYNTLRSRLALPFLSDLIKLAEEHNFPLEIVDERGAPEFPAPQEDHITSSLLPGITLEDYQVRILKDCCKHDIGIISATTGSGKSEIMCGLVKMFRCPTTIITEQIVVLEQIVKRLELRNVVHNNDIGLFCSGNMPDGNLVIVGSIQSASSPKKPDKSDVSTTSIQAIKKLSEWALKKNECIRKFFPSQLADVLYNNPSNVSMVSGRYLILLKEYCNKLEWDRLAAASKTRSTNAHLIQAEIKKCDLLLVDEADLATGKQYGKLFKTYFSGRRRFGFSGTPFDRNKPVQNLLLRENLGNIISKVSRKEVEDTGRIIPIKMFMLGVGEDGDRKDSRAYDIAMREEIIDNDSFHQLVCSVQRSFSQDGTLILIDTSPIESLGVRLEEIIPNSKFIFGKTSKKERRKYIESFEKRELSCLIGSKILKRGFDLIGGVENLILIGGGQQWSDFEQKVGRAVRKNKRGWARVFGFFFLNNKYLYKHSRENLKAIVEMGYDTKVIIGGVEIDGEKLIKSRFRIKKE